jgi:predicted permease
MGLFKSLQKKTHKEKIRIIWIVMVLTALLLVAAWIIASRYSKNSPKDTSLFQVIYRGFGDVKNSLRKK